jgi:hypothetical protein
VCGPAGGTDSCGQARNADCGACTWDHLVWDASPWN